MEKEFNNLKKTDYEYLKKFGLIEALDKKIKEIKVRLKNINRDKYNPTKFASENCELFCSEDCSSKYYRVLIDLKHRINEIDQDIRDIRNSVFYYKDGKKNKELYEKELEKKLKIIDNYVQQIENLTKEKAYQYNFNYKEITERGNFYKNKLLGIKKSIENAIKEENFYLYSKFVNEGIGNQILTVFKEFKTTFSELDRDYFVILKDKKINYRVYFEMYSWNDRVDYPEEHTLAFYADLPKELFDKLNIFLKKTNGEKYLCKGNFYHNYISCFINDNYLYEFLKQILNRSFYPDTDFEIYISDAYVVYYHLYELVGKDMKKETKWVEVDEKTFNTFKELNTVVMAKPLGYFEDQIVIEPKEIYNKVLNNPYYINTTDNNIAYVLWIIRNKLPYLSLPDPKYPDELRKYKRYEYFSSKKILSDYAKKYGLDKNILNRYKVEEEKKQDYFYPRYGSGTGGLRTAGSRYRGGGYGGFGK